MATPTAPTVVLPPQEPAPAPAAPTGPLAAIINPVQPARPVQPIGSTASMAEESIRSESGTRPAKTTERSGGAQESHWAALVRAVAARIQRTGTTKNFKHTVTEARVSGNQVNTANRISRDAKQHHIAQHQTARDAKLADLSNKIRQHSGRDHRDAKTSDAKAATSASRNGRDVKDNRDAKTTDTTTAAKKDATTKTDQTGQDIKATTSAPTKDGATKTDTAKKTDPGKAGQEGQRTSEKPTTDNKTTTRPRTQPSREAGYHDGTKAATVVGHVKAYRDGAKDGYADGTVEYETEKRRMDRAKARNAMRPTAPVKPEMAPASGSTVNLAKKAKPAAPVQLTGISEQTVSFDADNASHTLSRAEVRTLKGFSDRIAAKVPVLQKVAEGSKRARANAVDHATRAQRLAEAAKDVKGGAQLAAKLQRLAEQALALRAKAEEVEKAAHRGAEAVTVLVANVHTRHGGIYRAVADSPLTSPAEREFYQDKEGS